MKALELKVPPPLLALAFGAGMWALSLAGIGAWPRGPAATVAAIVIALVGISLVVAGNLTFHRAKTTVNPFKPETASSLVTGGIYRVTRNPIYVGLLVVLAGWAVFLANAFSLLGLALFPLYMTRFQIIPEERALRSLFGDAYFRYSSRVRRWL